MPLVLNARTVEVKGLCERLLELAPGERGGHLLELCPNEPKLREQVEELIALATAGDGHVHPGILAQLGPDSLSASSRAFPAPGRSPASRDSLLSTFVGRYRILSLIGEGGMGAVYKAEQEQPRRPVALKLIRPGLAMELIDGQTLTAYARAGANSHCMNACSWSRTCATPSSTPTSAA